jgi:hypothetical protein
VSVLPCLLSDVATTTGANAGSWDGLKQIPTGRLIFWLVSLSSEEIVGFVVEGAVDLLLSS